MVKARIGVVVADVEIIFDDTAAVVIIVAGESIAFVVVVSADIALLGVVCKLSTEFDLARIAAISDISIS